MKRKGHVTSQRELRVYKEYSYPHIQELFIIELRGIDLTGGRRKPFHIQVTTTVNDSGEAVQSAGHTAVHGPFPFL